MHAPIWKPSKFKYEFSLIVVISIINEFLVTLNDGPNVIKFDSLTTIIDVLNGIIITKWNLE